jgi:hypothetical protein
MVVSKHEPSTSLIKEIILNQMNYPHKTVGFLVSLMLLLGTVILTSCQTAESDEVTQVANVEPVLLETVTAVFPTEEPPAELIAEPVPIDNCLDCHTNKELLIQTADPKEEVISENEGEG